MYRWGAHHSFYGGADYLYEANRRLGSGFAGAPVVSNTSVLQVALDGLRFGCAASEHAPSLEGNNWPHTSGALRDDGDRHGPFEPFTGRATAGQRRDAAAERRGSACRRERQTSSCWNPR